MIWGESVDQLLKETPLRQSGSQLDSFHPSISFQRISCAQGRTERAGGASPLLQSQLGGGVDPGQAAIMHLAIEVFPIGTAHD